MASFITRERFLVTGGVGSKGNICEILDTGDLIGGEQYINKCSRHGLFLFKICAFGKPDIKCYFKATTCKTLLPMWDVDHSQIQLDDKIIMLIGGYVGVHGVQTSKATFMGTLSKNKRDITWREPPPMHQNIIFSLSSLFNWNTNTSPLFNGEKLLQLCEIFHNLNK